MLLSRGPGADDRKNEQSLPRTFRETKEKCGDQSSVWGLSMSRRKERMEAEQGMEAEVRKEEGNRRIATDRGKAKGRKKKRRGRRGEERKKKARGEKEEKRSERREEKKRGDEKREDKRISTPTTPSSEPAQTSPK